MIVVKDKRTHRVAAVTTAAATMQSSGSTINIPITCTVTNQGNILMVLSEAETADLVAGTYSYDVVANPFSRTRTIETGTIEVSTVDTITPLEGTFNMQINYRQRTDYYLDFSWTDSAGVLISAQSARLQARSATNVLSLDIRWFAAVPTEGTISALPAIQRGYLSPKTGSSLTLHISDTNTIAAGTYTFDLQAQDASGNWDTVASGNIVVSATITDRTIP